MAVTAGSATFMGTGPTVSGQILAVSGVGGDFARAIVGRVTLTLDGSATTVTVNIIDGTKTLSFTPTRAFFSRNGGTGLASIVPASITAITNKDFLVTLSAAGTNTETIFVAFILLP